MSKTEDQAQAMPVKIVDPQMGSMVSNAEIDRQIATAKEYPRSIQQCLHNLKTLTCMNERTALACHYVSPDGKIGVPRGGKVVDGPSIRFAEILASCWQNGRVGSRIVAEGDEFVTAEGIYMDLENNVAVRTEVQRRITHKDGKRYNVDGIGNAANAAASIARRNAILAGIPRPLWWGTWEETWAVAKGDEKSFDAKRTAAIEYAKTKYGVSPDRLFRRLDVKGEADITMETLTILRVLLESLNNGEATADAVFPLEDPTAASQAAAVAETLKAKRESAKTPEPKQAEPEKAPK